MSKGWRPANPLAAVRGETGGPSLALLRDGVKDDLPIRIGMELTPTLATIKCRVEAGPLPSMRGLVETSPTLA